MEAVSSKYININGSLLDLSTPRVMYIERDPRFFLCRFPYAD